jgi:hypothetical protein
MRGFKGFILDPRVRSQIQRRLHFNKQQQQQQHVP